MSSILFIFIIDESNDNDVSKSLEYFNTARKTNPALFIKHQNHLIKEALVLGPKDTLYEYQSDVEFYDHLNQSAKPYSHIVLTGAWECLPKNYLKVCAEKNKLYPDSILYYDHQSDIKSNHKYTELKSIDIESWIEESKNWGFFMIPVNQLSKIAVPIKWSNSIGFHAQSAVFLWMINAFSKNRSHQQLKFEYIIHKIDRYYTQDPLIYHLHHQLCTRKKEFSVFQMMHQDQVVKMTKNQPLKSLSIIYQNTFQAPLNLKSIQTNSSLSIEQIPHEKNMHPAIEKSNGEWLAIFHPGFQVKDDWIEEIKDQISKHPNINIFLFNSAETHHPFLNFTGNRDWALSRNSLPSFKGIILIKRPVYDQINHLDPYHPLEISLHCSFKKLIFKHIRSDNVSFESLSFWEQSRMIFYEGHQNQLYINLLINWNLSFTSLRLSQVPAKTLLSSRKTIVKNLINHPNEKSLTLFLSLCFLIGFSCEKKDIDSAWQLLCSDIQLLMTQ